MAGTLSAAPPAAAHEEDTYTFTGSGWGHSIGLSQYGAFGQALEGTGYADILDYYYADVTVETLDDMVGRGALDAGHPLVTDADPIWVGIRQGEDAIEIEPVGGPFEICQDVDGSATCVDVGWSAEATAETWRVSVVDHEGVLGCLLERLDPPPGEGEEPPIGHADCRLDVRWGGAGQATRVALDGEACADSSAGRECFQRGSLHVRSSDPAAGFHVVAELSMPDYLYGLGEMPSSWPAEALKAQAVAGRSYAVSRVLAHEHAENATADDPGLTTYRKSTCWCHVYSTSYDQNYVGYAKEADPAYGADWLATVDATSGEVLTHPEAGDGVVLAFYHSSSGGHTETNEAVWGTSAVAYLVPVADPWSNDEAVGNPFVEWSIEVSAGQLAAELGWDDVTHVTMTTSAPDARFEVRGTLDGLEYVDEVSAGWLYGTFGTRSPHFDAVTVDRYQPFLDMEGTGHSDAIYAVWEAGITHGCGDDYYCPGDPVSRAQMASFLARALGLEPLEEGPFVDVEGTGPHRTAINAVAAAGISLGCGDGNFCPDELVNRAQMASFLARALDLEPVSTGPFTDLDGSGGHQQAINAIAAAEISLGCAEGLFCPGELVDRAQMASFLARAFVWVEESAPGPTE